MSETIYYMDTNNGNDIPVPASELGGGGGINIEEIDIGTSGELRLKKTVGELYAQYGEFWPTHIIIGYFYSNSGFELLYPIAGSIVPAEGSSNASVALMMFSQEETSIKLKWNPDNAEEYPVIIEDKKTKFNVPQMGEPSYAWHAPSWVIDILNNHSGTLYFSTIPDSVTGEPHYYVDFSSSSSDTKSYAIGSEYYIVWTDESIMNGIVNIEPIATSGYYEVEVTDAAEPGIDYVDYRNL